MELAVLSPSDSDPTDYTEVLALHQQQGGTLVYRNRDKTLWKTFTDTVIKFVQLDPKEKETGRETSRYGKYGYISDTWRYTDEEP
jgi:hypothetical protein